jgi:hypothetical protein
MWNATKELRSLPEEAFQKCFSRGRNVGLSVGVMEPTMRGIRN